MSNFAKAAESLNVAPSTVSARIRQFEGVLGLSLFTRGHHTVGLTPAGKRMARHARFLLGAWESAYEDVALGKGHDRRLVIAGVSNLWDICLQEWLLAIYTEMPSLGLRIEENTTKRVVQKLERGQIDLGIILEPLKLREVLFEEVRTIPLWLVSSQSDIKAQEAVSTGYVRVDWGSTFSSLHENHFPQRPIAPVRINSGRLALNLILGRSGSAYLPQPMVEPLVTQGRLYRVADAPVIELKAYAAYPMHAEHRSLIAELVQRLAHPVPPVATE